MSEAARKVESNIRERVSSVTLLTDGATKSVRAAIDHLVKIEPVQAVAAFISEVGDGTGSFIKKQAEITRRWIK